MNGIISAIVFLPLLGFLLITFGKHALSKSLAAILACGVVLASFGLSIYSFLELRHSGQAITEQLYNWASLGNFNLSFSFLFDQLSGIMALIITGVGSLIHIYSVGYMHDDDAFNRFMSYLNLFIFFMLILVLGQNFLMLFAGWEGVGLCSYLLIGFWFKNADYNYAARKAFVMNRIGDFGLLIGLFLLVFYAGSLEYSDVLFGSAGYSIPTGILTIITICLFIGATGKSAQLPLFTWLPDAMAGPTPVSALIHAATMVTAGVYLVIRCNVLFSATPITMNIIAAIGILTALITASIGLKQNDIKKVLAYSTVSQLGLMVFALGLGAYTTALFHVTTHAFFKALLFLAAGSVIHALHGEQDIRNMGGLRSKLPITFPVFIIGTLAISGIPPLSGFFSKDEILMAALNRHPLLWVLGIIVSLMTVFYMWRLVFLTFYGKYRGDHHKYDHAHESPAVMTIPLIVLAVLSTIGGFMNVPEIFHGHSAFAHFLSPIVETSHDMLYSHSVEFAIMGVTLALIAGVIYYAYKKFALAPVIKEEKGFGKLLENKYYFDETYDKLIAHPVSNFAGFTRDFIERHIVDGAVEGFSSMSQGVASAMRSLQSGNIEWYLFAFVLGIIMLILGVAVV